ncbi:PepSY-associated TM helix domain-containing protein [Acetobacter syzygii]|uniref:PepSY-associated TM helix domain-containing protein n=1 Tax=Acetobacter syzygii TaxID=146476 RepID=UPI0015705C46|nr:PepSY-associated TM helix domain-containing protein [Acetobacter syzygii]NSL93083.1 PepSY domain-containing protein [Acetobacter syzygii]
MTPARRARLAWMHRWAGLVTGWFAFAIFFTGTLALFDTELTRWMQPETAIVPYNSQLTTQALERAQQLLYEADKAGSSPSFLLLPEPRDPTLRILHYDGHKFVGPILDPSTGKSIMARNTEGGSFFFTFHYTLRIPSPWGERVVAGIAFAFAAIMLSGILLHLKRLMPDYFTLRLQASLPRCLLDLHVITGSAMLPFHIMIVWTGLLLTAENALPIIQSSATVPTAQTTITTAPVHWSPHASLALMIQKAQTSLGRPPSYVLFDDEKTTISAIRHNSLNANDSTVVFNSLTGQFLSKTAPASDLEDIYYVMSGLHISRSMGFLLRWIWFVGGTVSTIMIASGLVYYTAKQKKHTQPTFCLVQRLNIAVMGGLVCSSLSLFVSNRLLPAHWQVRSSAEIWVFFSVWASCLLLCLIAPTQKSRQIITWAIGLAGFSLPAIDFIAVPLAQWESTLHLTINGFCALAGLIAMGYMYSLPTSKHHD